MFWFQFAGNAFSALALGQESNAVFKLQKPKIMNVNATAHDKAVTANTYQMF